MLPFGNDLTILLKSFLQSVLVVHYKGLLAVVWGTGVVLSSVMTARSIWDVEMRSISTIKEWNAKK
jgi:hypothetical protein